MRRQGDQPSEHAVQVHWTLEPLLPANISLLNVVGQFLALVRIPVFLDFLVSLSLKIVWAARSDQVQLPSMADRPRARHLLRLKLAVEVLWCWLFPFGQRCPYREMRWPHLNYSGRL